MLRTKATPAEAAVGTEGDVVTAHLDDIAAEHPLLGEGIYNTVERLLRAEPDPVVVAGIFIEGARESRRNGCGVCAAYLDACRYVVLDLIARLS